MIELKQVIENTSWVDGTSFKNNINLLEFFVDGSLPFSWCDYFRPAVNIPLFSERMRRWLDILGVDNVDYYDATVTNTQSGETRRYYAANIIGQVLGLDVENSEYDLFDEDSYLAEDIQKLVLDESKFSNLKLCRLAEYDLLVIAHEEVKAVFEENNAVGVIFLEPELWDGFAT
jgi:hypothetical protein